LLSWKLWEIWMKLQKGGRIFNEMKFMVWFPKSLAFIVKIELMSLHGFLVLNLKSCFAMSAYSNGNIRCSKSRGGEIWIWGLGFAEVGQFIWLFDAIYWIWKNRIWIWNGMDNCAEGFFMCFGLVGLTVTIFESCCGFMCVSNSENGWIFEVWPDKEIRLDEGWGVGPG